MELLTFVLEERGYALYLSAVQRIVRMVEITPLPKAPDIAMGVINVHGKIVPVVNVRRRFRLPDREIGLQDKLIIAKTSRRTVALIADEVVGVVDKPEHELVRAGEILPGTEYVKGILKLENGMVLVHDLDEFLSLEEEKALDQAMNEAREK